MKVLDKPFSSPKHKCFQMSNTSEEDGEAPLILSNEPEEVKRRATIKEEADI